MATRAEKMAKRGFSRVGQGHYLKLERRGTWMVGQAVCFPPGGGFVRLQRAYPLAEAQVEAIAAMIPEAEIIGYEIGARRGRRRINRRVLRKMGKKFRRRVNKTAKRIAATRIVKGLNVAKAKALQSPIASAGVAAAARALSSFGVPASVTKLALNQARFAAADRAKQGGTAAMVARFSEGAITDKAHRKAVLREVARRRKAAVLQGVKASIPRGAVLGKVDLGAGAQTGFDPYY